MSSFIEKIKDYLEDIKYGTQNDIILLALSFVVMLLSNVIGVGIVFSAIITLLVGVIWEFLYCYSPKTSISVLKWDITVPDIKTFISNVKSFIFTKYNDFNKGYIMFNVAGIVIYMILKAIVNIIF